jgi:glycosyltransferase involved in cell wall biosynthesis
MKILLVNSLYAPNFVGGAERSVQALAEGLAGMGHRVTVVSTANNPANREAEVNGVRVHYLGFKNSYWTYEDRPFGRLEKAAWHARDTYNRAMADELAGIVGRDRPDIMHTNNLVGISVAAWDAIARLGVPIAHTLRDYYLMCPRSTMFKRGKSCDRPCGSCSLYGIARRRASRKVAAVVGVSRFILDKHLRNGYFPAASEARAIRTGHDPKPCSAPRRDPEPGRLKAGFLGNLSPNKGIEALLSAVARLPEDRVELHVGGTGKAEYQADLLRRFNRPNVRFHGQIPAAEFLRSLDVLVVSSLWEEPLARVIVEALACGTPVVTTPRGGSPEVVVDGFNGLVCDGDGVDSLHAALERLLLDRDLLMTLRRNAAEHAETRTVRAMLEDYVDLYDAVRSDPARPPHGARVSAAQAAS